MGLNHITIAAVIAMLGGAPALHAETAPPADDMPAAEAAPAPSDPALDASPIAGTEPVTHPADVMEAPETPESFETPEPPQTPADAGKGDTLVMPKTPPAVSKKPSSPMPSKVEADNMPKRGASMAQVLKKFGQPHEKLPPVGDPPITRWNYGDYTVYFEREYVIHSVENSSQTAPAPAEQAPASESPSSATSSTPDTPATEPPPADQE